MYKFGDFGFDKCVRRLSCRCHHVADFGFQSSFKRLMLRNDEAIPTNTASESRKQSCVNDFATAEGLISPSFADLDHRTR